MEFFIIIDMMKAFLRTQNPECHKEKILIGRNNINVNITFKSLRKRNKLEKLI